MLSLLHAARPGDYFAGAFMQFSFRGISIGLASIALIFFGACDKHHLGELPEVQKEHVDLAQQTQPGPEPQPVASPAANKLDLHVPEMTPTPVEFFPESSPH